LVKFSDQNTQGLRRSKSHTKSKQNRFSENKTSWLFFLVSSFCDSFMNVPPYLRASNIWKYLCEFFSAQYRRICVWCFVIWGHTVCFEIFFFSLELYVKHHYEVWHKLALQTLIIISHTIISFIIWDGYLLILTDKWLLIFLIIN